jgi:hypothetical protein
LAVLASDAASCITGTGTDTDTGIVIDGGSLQTL